MFMAEATILVLGYFRVQIVDEHIFFQILYCQAFNFVHWKYILDNLKFTKLVFLFSVHSAEIGNFGDFNSFSPNAVQALL